MTNVIITGLLLNIYNIMTLLTMRDFFAARRWKSSFDETVGNWNYAPECGREKKMIFVSVLG